MFAGLWKTPLGSLDEVLFRNSFLKLPFFFFLQIGLLVAANRGRAARSMRAAPMDKALWASVLVALLWTIYGAALGGKPWMAGWQLYIFLSAILFAKLLLATMRT